MNGYIETSWASLLAYMCSSESDVLKFMFVFQLSPHDNLILSQPVSSPLPLRQVKIHFC